MGCYPTQHAIPKLCQIDGELRDVDGGYDYITPLQGLIQDMMDATSREEGLEAEWMSAASLDEELSSDDGDGMDPDVDDNNDGGGSGGVEKKKGPPKWYTKLAARALAVGVNYVQGTLALQALRRAAAERDQNMPKFPLF
jgi:hypothetical protein